jgi:hypothetical protein
MVIRRLVPLALVAATALLIPAARSAAAPDPSALPMGDPPAVTWQAGTTVHTASGKTVALPVGKAGARYQVLGKRRGEWILVIPGYDAKVLAVKGGKVRTVWKHVYDESDTHYTLAQGGSLVVEWNFDRAGSTHVAVFDLKGKVVASRSWRGTVRLLDFDGDTMLISTRTKAQLWTVPGKPVTAAPDADFGDLSADLLFVSVPVDSVGPTSLSAPGTPVWSSGSFIPLSLSPDGQYVAGLSYVYRLKLEVRRVSDGTVQPVPAFKAEFDSALGWEADGDLLVEVRSSSGRALVRCTVAGACERATDWVKGQEIGFPG